MAVKSSMAIMERISSGIIAAAVANSKLKQQLSALVAERRIIGISVMDGSGASAAAGGISENNESTQQQQLNGIAASSMAAAERSKRGENGGVRHHRIIAGGWRNMAAYQRWHGGSIAAAAISCGSMAAAWKMAYQLAASGGENKHRISMAAGGIVWRAQRHRRRHRRNNQHQHQADHHQRHRHQRQRNVGEKLKRQQQHTAWQANVGGGK